MLQYYSRVLSSLTIKGAFWTPSSLTEVFYKKDVLRNFAKFIGKHLCQSLFLNTVAGLRPESLAQVFSCEFCKISRNVFSYRTPPVAAFSTLA